MSEYKNRRTEISDLVDKFTSEHNPYYTIGYLEQTVIELGTKLDSSDYDRLIEEFKSLK